MKQIVLWTFFVSFCLQPVARACNSAEAKTAAETHLAEKFALKDDSKLEVDLTSKPSRSRIGNPMNIQGRASSPLATTIPCPKTSVLPLLKRIFQDRELGILPLIGSSNRARKKELGFFPSTRTAR